MANTDHRKTTEELIRSIQGVFKRSTRSAREKSWATLSSVKGRSEINKLINNPDRNISLYRDLISFKEWLNAS